MITLLMMGGNAQASAEQITLTGLDLHDGTMVQDGSSLYLYGTEYGCGFTWGENGTPWCGFGVATSRDVAGPWKKKHLLFSPRTKIKATGWTGDNGKTWGQMCGLNGAGCFNARMVRTRNKWLLWFNSPGDKGRHSNPYWVMTCHGPAGPCGNPHKPAIYGCYGGSDFSIAVDATKGYLVCSGSNRIIGIEQLAAGMTNGTKHFVANVSDSEAEGVGIYHTGKEYVATYSVPNCGYCSGTEAASPGAAEVQTGYSTAPSLGGPWTDEGVMPGGYCTGQPRTAFKVKGIPYEWVDEWEGTPNETAAAILLVPMTMSPWSCASQDNPQPQ
jgi:hypothetical protein